MVYGPASCSADNGRGRDEGRKERKEENGGWAAGWRGKGGIIERKKGGSREREGGRQRSGEFTGTTPRCTWMNMQLLLEMDEWTSRRVENPP